MVSLPRGREGLSGDGGPSPSVCGQILGLVCKNSAESASLDTKKSAVDHAYSVSMISPPFGVTIPQKMVD